MSNLWILAQAESESITSEPVDQEQTTTAVVQDANAPPPTTRRSPFGNLQFFFLIIIIIFFWLVMFRGPRKKQQEHRKMVASLQRNDRVRTIGGILGTVVDVRDDEIVLKVDESNNTKIRISPNAIGARVSEDKG